MLMLVFMAIIWGIVKMSKKKSNKDKVYLSKKIGNYELYVYADIFDDLRIVLEDLVNDDIKKMLYETSVAIHKQVNHLKCDEITDFYIVEKGYKLRG